MWALQKVRPHVAFISLFLRWCYNHKFWTLLKKSCLLIYNTLLCLPQNTYSQYCWNNSIPVSYNWSYTKSRYANTSRWTFAPVFMFDLWSISQIWGKSNFQWNTLYFLNFFGRENTDIFSSEQWHKAHRVWHHDELHLVKNIEYRFYQINGRSRILYFSALETSQLHDGTLWIHTYFYKHYR